MSSTATKHDLQDVSSSNSDDVRRRGSFNAQRSDQTEKRSISDSSISNDSPTTDGESTDNNDIRTSIEVPRTITLLGGIAFVVGTIIGSGIFVSPKGVARGSGSVGMTMVSWVICGVVSLIGAFCFAELGTVIKESGADYAYLHYGYGPFFSYMYTWVNSILVKPASLATICLTCSEYLMVLFFDVIDDCGNPPVLISKLLAVFMMFLLAAINVYSVKLSARIQTFFAFGKLIALSIIIIGGIVKLAQGYTEYLETGFEGTETNVGKITIGLYSGMWAYDGWNTANFMTEEIIRPERNLPLAILIGVPITMVVYIMTNISYFTVMSLDDLLNSPAVGITWAERVMPQFVWLIPIFVAMSTFGTGNGSLFTSGRLIFVAARNEHFPEMFAMVHVRKYTPVTAVILTLILAIAFTVYSNINQLIDFVSFLKFIFYALCFLAVIIFRYKKDYKDLPRPVKIPLVIPVLAFITAVFMVVAPIAADPQIEFLYAAVLLAIGVLVWLPLVYFRVRFNFMLTVTKYIQLWLQVMKPKQTST